MEQYNDYDYGGNDGNGNDDGHTVEEHSYQNISNNQHPLLRIHKLTKRIQ